MTDRFKIYITWFIGAAESMGVTEGESMGVEVWVNEVWRQQVSDHPVVDDPFGPLSVIDVVIVWPRLPSPTPRDL